MRIGASEYLTTREAAMRVGAKSPHAFSEWARRRRHLIQPKCYGNRNLWDRVELDQLLAKEAKRRGRAA